MSAARGSLLWRLCLLTTISSGSLLAQFGDYAGPAILSRGGGGGTAPSAPIQFRPYLNLSGIYQSGLAGAVLAPNGKVANDAGYGGEVAVGLYGYHSWRHTVVGVNYRGDYRRYSRGLPGYDGTNQFLSLGVTHQATPKLVLSLRQGAGTFQQNMGYFGSFGFFDPSFAQIPNDELLDTRTEYLTSMVDATYLWTRRLSVNVGGTGFTVRRRVSSLYGVTGGTARGDIAYRVTRRTTIGADYFFTHFAFDKSFGSSDLHSAGLNYSWQISRNWTLALRGAFMQIENVFVGAVPLDPLVAALIGRSVGYRVQHHRSTEPSGSIQLSRQFRHSSAQISFNRGATPGNGVFLTSSQSSALASYSYTGMRHWSLGTSCRYSDMRGIGQDIGRQRLISGGGSIARSLGSRKNLFLTLRFEARRIQTQNALTRNTVLTSIGIAYSPGDTPIRLW